MAAGAGIEPADREPYARLAARPGLGGHIL